MNIVRTIAEVRQAVRDARARGATIGFVPTMGAFHDGHLSLMREARSQTGFTVVSLFVNPAQFNNPADLIAYPRDEARDAAMAAAENIDLLFTPEAASMYADGFATSVNVAGLSEPLDGAFRGPEHFRGVATVVTKLFNIVGPDVAFFGQKDAQQAAIIRQMVRDLDFPVRVVVCPTVREADGLAMSSAAMQCASVPMIAFARSRCAAASMPAEMAIAAGMRDGAKVAETGRAAMRAHDVEPEYFEIVSAATLRPVTPLAGELLVAVAAHVGPVRLIDNALVHLPAAP